MDKERINLLTKISLNINEVKDLDILLERILTNARMVFNADAGSIYIRRGNELEFSYTQNNSLQKRLGPGKKLIYKTFSIPINNESIAGYVANKKELLNINDVYRIPKSKPYTFDSTFDSIANYKTRSILTVPMTNQRNQVFGVMQIINALGKQGEIIPFSKDDESLISFFATTAALSLERAQMTRNIILRMINMAELRDPNETCAHANRVASYAVEIYEAWAREKKITPKQIQRQKDLLRSAAMLHDVGKVAISDLILKKPAKLTLDEFEVMKGHTFLGASLFKDEQSEFDEIAAEVALSHHERWDGTGYPGDMEIMFVDSYKNLKRRSGSPAMKGDDIPIFGRIVAVADVYDALSSRRSYKEPWDEAPVLEEMRRGAGTHFDPEVVEAFFSCLDLLRSIAKRYPDEPKK